MKSWNWLRGIHCNQFSGTEDRKYRRRANYRPILESLEARLSPAITLSPSTLPSGTIWDNANGGAYSQLISASGGIAPYTFAETGTLPQGITLSSTGSLSGIPL